MYTNPRHITSSLPQKIHDLAFSPDGRRLVSCGQDRHLRVFDVDLNDEVASVRLDAEPLCVAFDGQLALVGTDAGDLVIWDVVARRLVRSFQAHKGPVRAIAVASDGRRVVTGGDDKSIAVFDAA